MPEILRGNAQVFQLPSLLQLMEAEGITGWLVWKDAGRIGYRAGRPVAAECGDFRGVTGLLELFLMPTSEFTLEAATKVDGDVLGDVVGLVMEGCRLMDEWMRLENMQPLPRSEASEFDHEQLAKLLPRLNGRLTLGAAIQTVGLARVDLIDPVLELIEEGKLYEATSPPPPIRQAAPGDYYAAMDLGRQSMRDGDFDQAEVAFEQALVQRPDDRIAAQNLKRVREMKSGKGTNVNRWFSGR